MRQLEAPADEAEAILAGLPILEGADIGGLGYTLLGAQWTCHCSPLRSGRFFLRVATCSPS